MRILRSRLGLVGAPNWGGGMGAVVSGVEPMDRSGECAWQIECRASSMSADRTDACGRLEVAMTAPHARSWLCRIVAVSAVLVMCVGCSSSSKGVTSGAPTKTQPPPPASGFVDASFRTRTAATCKTAGDALHAAGPFPFPNFDPEHPVVADLLTIGRYEVKTVAALRVWQAALHALGQPTAGSGAWKAYLSAIDQSVTSTIAQQRAAQGRDGAAFTQTYRDLSSRSPGNVQAAAAIGLPSCDPGNPA